ncbi:MAG: DUF3107 domain-containing protein [Propionibacteriaceae bacterium]|jgi:hypothetical protein|nr:DUF3107 domain-containing protein [Propionibacteriaceae bacterium]
MEIKIGIRDVNREVVVDTEEKPDRIIASLTAALADGGVFTLDDSRGRKVIIPAAGIAYVEVGQEHVRPVGFGAA